MLAKRYPCRCRGVGCQRCDNRGYLRARGSYAQGVNLMPSISERTDRKPNGGALPF